MAEAQRQKRILIVGVGGLGVPAALAIARAGVGRLTLLDPDPVELSNLARQVIYRVEDVGGFKVDAARRRLLDRFPNAQVDARAVALDESNAHATIAARDFIIDATDNPATKFLINDVCLAENRPFAYGGVLGLGGQAMTIVPGETACLRCLFEEPPDDAEIASCRESGIIGPVAGAIGIAQAGEAIRFIRGQTPTLAGTMLTYDAAGSPRVRLTPISPRQSCRCAAYRQNISAGASSGAPRV